MFNAQNFQSGPRLVLLPNADIEPLAESLVALANSSGGLIVLGVTDAGEPSDEIWEDEAEMALRQAISQCDPPVMCHWQTVEVGERRYVGIQTPRSLEMHSLNDGRIFVRSGLLNRLMVGDEIRKVAAGKSAADFETEPMPGATVDDFDGEIVQEYLAKRKQRGSPLVTSEEQLLFEIGAIDGEGTPTIAGILLFGRNPRAFLPQSGVVFVKFPGTEPRSSEGGASYGRRDDIHGPLARVVERAWSIVWDEMRIGAKIDKLEREEKPEYPRFAVREALVNAMCHRDYRIRGRRVEVRMYADRLEVISPGGLPGYMTLDNLVEEHYSRNPQLVNGLYQWGYIEELGLGIDQMIEDMVAAGHSPPKFDALPHLFTVTLFNDRKKTQSAPPSWSKAMNERQARAMQYVREHGSISNREYQSVCPNVSPETLRLDLADLVERGLLLKIGSKRGTHYILK